MTLELIIDPKAIIYLKNYYQENQKAVVAEFEKTNDYRNLIINSINQNGLCEENWKMIVQRDFGNIGQGASHKPTHFEEINNEFKEALKYPKLTDDYDDMSQYFKKFSFGHSSWFRKYLTIFYPDKFTPFYSSTWAKYYLDRLNIDFRRDGYRYKINKYYRAISNQLNIAFIYVPHLLYLALGPYDIGFYVDKAFLDINRSCTIDELVEYVNSPFSRNVRHEQISKHIFKNSMQSPDFNAEERYIEEPDLADYKNTKYSLSLGYKDLVKIKYYPWEGNEFKLKPQSYTEQKLQKDISISLTTNISTEKDLLSRGTYARALAALIKNKKTKSPLNIGLCAKWGAGKTHLIGLIKEQLKTSDKEEMKTIVVDFDAWQYEDQKRIWGGLIESILKKQKEYCWFSYISFLSWKLRAQVKMENIMKFFICFLFWSAIYNILVWLSSILPNHLEMLEQFIRLNDKPLWSLVSTLSLITIIAPALIKNPFINLDDKFLKYLAFPNYNAHLGFQDEIKDLVNFAVNDMTRSFWKGATKKRIVLFIDNLDRCSLENIVKVLDAICLFLNCCSCKKEKLNIVSLLAIDYRIVYAAVSKKLDLATDLIDSAEKVEEYLDKIVNFPFFIPNEENLNPLLCEYLSLKYSHLPEDKISKRIYEDENAPIDEHDNADEGEDLDDDIAFQAESKNTESENMPKVNIKSMTLVDDEKYYIKEVLQYIHKNTEKKFTPRSVNKFISQYLLFKFIFADKYNGITCDPKWLAYWFGLVLLYEDKIMPEDIKKTQKSIFNKEVTDKDFLNEFKLKDLFEKNPNLAEKLNKESAIFIKPSV